MKAVMLTAPGVLEHVDVPDPRVAADDDVLIRVRAVSICGSDTHGYTGFGGRRVPPLIMGHEAMGEVLEVGRGVTEVVPGNRVFIVPMLGCDTCRTCREGHPDACASRKLYGADMPGAMAERIVIKARNAVPLPDQVSDIQGAMVESMSVVTKGLERAAIQAGDTHAVVGGGPIGLLAVGLLALHHPRHLVVVEPSEVRRRVALQMGATHVIDPGAGDPAEQLLAITGGRAADLTVEAVGITPTVASAVNVTRAGGTLIWLGNAGRVVEIDEFKVVWNSLTIHASVGMTRPSVLRSIELLAAGVVPAERIVSVQVPLAEGAEAFVRQANDASIVKTAILP